MPALIQRLSSLCILTRLMLAASTLTLAADPCRGGGRMGQGVLPVRRLDGTQLRELSWA